MNYNDKQIQELIEAYLNNTCTPAEREIVEKHFLDFFEKSQSTPTSEDLSESFTQVYQSLVDKIQSNSKPSKKAVWLRLLPYAAAILLLLGAVSLLWLPYRPTDNVSSLADVDPIMPARNRAVLSIDGNITVLNEDKNRIIVEDKQIKYADGTQLEINNSGVPKEYKLQTPKAGTYQMQLPDGTLVWLNAASTLSYSSNFEKGNSRKVQLEGEAYFEVAKDSRRRFIVETANTQVEVLGTHFNVNTYPDESSIKTTLLEGSVKVTSTLTTETKLLKAGQQAQTSKSGKIKIESNIDTEEVLSWKNRVFKFTNADLATVMKQLSRWYDVEVDIENLPAGEFNGILSRDIELSQTLNIIGSTTGLKFKVKERRILMAK